MKVKKGPVRSGDKVFEAVSLVGVSKDIRKAFPIIDKAYRNHGYEAVISSGTEWFYEIDNDPFLYFIHSLTSDHYDGNAVDVSCRDIPTEQAIMLQGEIQSRLDAIGPGYIVIYHGKYKHFHIGYKG